MRTLYSQVKKLYIYTKFCHGSTSCDGNNINSHSIDFDMMNSMIQSGFKYLIANTVNKNLEIKFILNFIHVFNCSLL